MINGDVRGLQEEQVCLPTGDSVFHLIQTDGSETRKALITKSWSYANTSRLESKNTLEMQKKKGDFWPKENLDGLLRDKQKTINEVAFTFLLKRTPLCWLPGKYIVKGRRNTLWKEVVGKQGLHQVQVHCWEECQLTDRFGFSAQQNLNLASTMKDKKTQLTAII